MKVAILGATGETGSSIIDALLESQPTGGNNTTFVSSNPLLLDYAPTQMAPT